MFVRLSKLLLVAVLSCTLGLHWALLQVAAWTGMVVTYSQTVPVKEALAMTFDGQHPCNLCKLVRAGQRSEQQKEATQPIVKFDLFSPQSSPALCPPVIEPQMFAFRRPADARSESPPLPPPRALQG